LRIGGRTPLALTGAVDRLDRLRCCGDHAERPPRLQALAGVFADTSGANTLLLGGDAVNKIAIVNEKRRAFGSAFVFL
jgi:hypothetical protein